LGVGGTPTSRTSPTRPKAVEGNLFPPTPPDVGPTREGIGTNPPLPATQRGCFNHFYYYFK